MALLIDGYNLLHASGVFPAQHLPGTLHHARTALLEELVAMLSEREVEHTTIVFDSAEAPPGLPNRMRFGGLDVRFASDHADADEMIELLIEASHAPRDLTVVSSDHRLHRAARRRRATPVDSDVWFLGLRAMRRLATDERASAKPQQPLSAGEVAYWMKTFGRGGELPPSDGEIHNPNCAASEPDLTASKPQAGSLSEESAADASPEMDRSRRTEPPIDPNQPWPEPEIYNPFPPGYCDDLFEEE